MLVKLFKFLQSLSPTISKKLWLGWYQYLAKNQKHSFWTFMNYGYADLDDNSNVLQLSSEDEKDRPGIQLYDHVVKGLEIEGKEMLEIGSGRGGGSSYIARYYNPKLITGIDFSNKAIQLSNKLHDVPNLQFQHGDAEFIPFNDNSFDVVINVESSFCYNSMDLFLSEVYRILRSGGHFSWVDFRHNDLINETETAFKNAALILVSEKDITDNVLRSLDLFSEEKMSSINKHIPWYLKKSFSSFSGTNGTKIHNAFKTGQTKYLSKVLQKPK